MTLTTRDFQLHEVTIGSPRPVVRKRDVAYAALACVLFLPTGLVSLTAVLRAKRFQSSDIRAARRELHGSRTWCLWSVSIFAVCATVVIAIAALTANDHSVISTFFQIKILTSNAGYLLGGFWLNVRLFLIGEVVILVWALVIALLRELPGKPLTPIRFLATVYSDTFRGLPMLLVMLVVGLGLERTGLPVVSHFNEFESSLFALTLCYGAYISEVYRAGLSSIHWSQAAAARSLGLSAPKTFRLVVLPQAVRNVVPPLLNGFISLQKDTALVSTVGLLDAVNRAQAVSSYEATLTPYMGVAICFLVITIPMTRYVDYLLKKNRRQTLAKG